MGRIENKFKELRKNKKKALILYITSGDPSLKKTEELVYAFEKEGVDLIELGVPFSDPLADGVVIQDASQRALKNGVDLKKILRLIQKVRQRSQIPLLLMTYLNPVLAHGIQKFALDAKKAGVDGLIVPDLPPDEGKEIQGILKRHGIDLVYLLAPTSDEKRRKLIGKSSSGFIYYVSLTGVTGTGSALPSEVNKNIILAQRSSSLPVCVGFGISTPEQARSAAKAADGVIVGSAIVRSLSQNPGLTAEQFSHKFVRPFAVALGKGR